MTTINGAQLLFILATLLIVILIMRHSVLRAREEKRREWLKHYQSQRSPIDKATCENLRGAGWPEDRIRLWCNSHRCVYYSPEYNSTDL